MGSQAGARPAAGTIAQPFHIRTCFATATIGRIRPVATASGGVLAWRNAEMTSEPYHVSIQIDEPFREKVNAVTLVHAAITTLAAESAPAPAELHLHITDDESVRLLNRDYRGIDSPTDVLSFGYEADDFVLPPGERRQLGEVVIAYPYTERSAARQGHSVADELLLLTVHGTLHILGYDDEEEEAWARMKARQDALLNSLRS